DFLQNVGRLGQLGGRENGRANEKDQQGGPAHGVSSSRVPTDCRPAVARDRRNQSPSKRVHIPRGSLGVPEPSVSFGGCGLWVVGCELQPATCNLQPAVYAASRCLRYLFRPMAMQTAP